ncbi:hypothetical protein ACFL2T_02995, partial [Elusimicrobiota bacterium]
VYKKKDEPVLVKVFHFPGVRERHIRELARLTGLLVADGLPVVPMEVVQLTDGRWGVRMPLIKGKDLGPVIEAGSQDGLVIYEHAHRAHTTALNTLDRIDEITGRLADRRGSFDEGEDFGNFLYTPDKRVVNIDPINMEGLLLRMDALETTAADPLQLPAAPEDMGVFGMFRARTDMTPDEIFTDPRQAMVHAQEPIGEQDSTAGTARINETDIVFKMASGSKADAEALRHEAEVNRRAYILSRSGFAEGYTKITRSAIRPVVLRATGKHQGLEAGAPRWHMVRGEALVTEQAPGRTLDEYLAEGNELHPDDWKSFMRTVNNLNKSGVAHGDLSPANVYVRPIPGYYKRVQITIAGFAKGSYKGLADFETALDADRRKLRTLDAMVKGEPLAPEAATLAPASKYLSLLRRQRGGEVLDLSNVVRPGLARSKGETIDIMQGSGRFEKLKAGDWMDVFVPEDDPLPRGAHVIQTGLSGKFVGIVNRLSSRGASGNNGILFKFMTEGRSFVRVLAPRDIIEAPMSGARHDIDEISETLMDWTAKHDLAQPFAKFLESPDFKDLSLLKQKDLLERMKDAAAIGPHAFEKLL